MDVAKIDRALYQVFFSGVGLSICFWNGLKLSTSHNFRVNRVQFTALIVWSVYVSIQLSDTWTTSNYGGQFPAYKFALTPFSTFLYSLTWGFLVYFSYQRFNCFWPIKKVIKVTLFAIAIILVAIRFVRTVFVFINSRSATFSTELIAALQASTIIPLILIRVIMDISSVVMLSSSRTMLSVKKTPIASAALRFMFTSLVTEIIFSIMAITIAVLEASGYTGYRPSFFDWLLISFALSNWFEQRDLNRRVFNKGTYGNDESSSTAVASGSQLLVTKSFV